MSGPPFIQSQSESKPPAHVAAVLVKVSVLGRTVFADRQHSITHLLRPTAGQETPPRVSLPTWCSSGKGMS